MIKGIDYAFGAHPAPAAVKAAGYGFACRYMSAIAANDANGKNLVGGELHALLTAGLDVVVVEESTAGRMKGGHVAGLADAAHALAVTAALGMDGIPVYFACDFDASPADQALINDYLMGAASVIGHARTGIYGGYYPVKRSLDSGHAAWAWQTSAWSGGQWDARAHIRQHGSVRIGGITVDYDEAPVADFGRWPRPAAPVVTPPPGTPAPEYPVPVGARVTVHPFANIGWPASDSPHWRVQVAQESAGKPGTVIASPVVTVNHAQVQLPGPGRYYMRVQAASDSKFTDWRPFTA
jgi:hypothetical protein